MVRWCVHNTTTPRPMWGLYCIEWLWGARWGSLASNRRWKEGRSGIWGEHSDTMSILRVAVQGLHSTKGEHDYERLTKLRANKMWAKKLHHIMWDQHICEISLHQEWKANAPMCFLPFKVGWRLYHTLMNFQELYRWQDLSKHCDQD